MAKKEEGQVISVRLEEEDIKWLKTHAKEEDLSVSQVIRRSIKLYRKETVDKK